jgi:hypothetical protein
MIIVSKRCYLNILTQLLDRDTLINANYYILDQTRPDRAATLHDRLDIAPDGTLMMQESTTSASSMGKYNVKYGAGELDPTSFMTSLTQGIHNQDNTPYEMFLNQIMKPSIMLAVYQFIFKDKVRGNGLQIGIICDDRICQYFGHIICLYLSKNYGCDINFIDPKYRKNTIGREFYPGDKIIAQKTILDLRDLESINYFKAALTQTTYDESVNNLRVWLSYMGFQQLIHLYNLLFPNDPLPPDNYTVGDLIEIIVGRSLEAMRAEQKETNNDFGSLLYSTNDWYETVERYNRETADYSQDEDDMI